MPPYPILYSFRRCPYAMRARLALIVSGQTVELREVALRDKPRALIEASPKATVPVLVLPDGRVIEQSLDIMLWALGRNDPDGWLKGHDHALIETNDGPFKHHLDRYKYPERHAGDPLAHRAEGAAMLERLEGRLRVADHLCGPRPSLADAAIFPFVRQFAATDRPWFDSLPLPHVRQWLDGLTGSALFERAMIRPLPWTEGQEPVIFPDLVDQSP
ncbi:MAG: glutathione S-transferase [Sphingobium sp.]